MQASVQLLILGLTFVSAYSTPKYKQKITLALFSPSVPFCAIEAQSWKKMYGIEKIFDR